METTSRDRILLSGTDMGVADRLISSVFIEEKTTLFEALAKLGIRRLNKASVVKHIEAENKRWLRKDWRHRFAARLRSGEQAGVLDSMAALVGTGVGGALSLLGIVSLSAPGHLDALSPPMLILGGIIGAGLGWYALYSTIRHLAASGFGPMVWRIAPLSLYSFPIPDEVKEVVARVKQAVPGVSFNLIYSGIEDGEVWPDPFLEVRGTEGEQAIIAFWDAPDYTAVYD